MKTRSKILTKMAPNLPKKKLMLEAFKSNLAEQVYQLLTSSQSPTDQLSLNGSTIIKGKHIKSQHKKLNTCFFV